VKKYGVSLNTPMSDGLSQTYLDQILKFDYIFIDAMHLHESLSMLNIENTKRYDTVRIVGNLLILPEDFSAILFKLSELNITKLCMVKINFGMFDENLNRLPCKIPTKLNLRQVTLDNCMYVYSFLPVLVHWQPISNSNRDYQPLGVKSLTHLTILVQSLYGKMIKPLADLMERNYRLRYVPVDSGFQTVDMSEINKVRAMKLKVEEYAIRNRNGYEKYLAAVRTVIGIRKRRKSILSYVVKDVVLIICRIISETNGTKVWTDNP